MQGVAVWPFLLAIAAYVAYQTFLKAARPEVNVLGLLMFAYLVSFVCAGLLWWRNQDLGANRLELRDFAIAAAVGASIVGIEFGFATAYRLGWPLNTAGAIVNVAAALIVVPIGYLLFAEQMSWTKALGLVMCCGGLALIARA
jgi:multidrug transporter EmrE-like cation transporter